MPEDGAWKETLIDRIDEISWVLSIMIIPRF